MNSYTQVPKRIKISNVILCANSFSRSLSPPPAVNPLWSAARLSIGSNKDSLAEQREAQPAEYREEIRSVIACSVVADG
jgi:hypothetical protein